MHYFEDATFLFALFWPILILIYYVALCVQIFFARRWNISGRMRIFVRTAIILEIFAPMLSLLIHPFVPGSTWRGEPLGISEKDGNIAIVTGLVCTLLFGFVTLILWLSGTKTQNTKNAQQGAAANP